MVMAYRALRYGRFPHLRVAQPLDIHDAAFGLRTRHPQSSAGGALWPPPVLMLGPLGFAGVLIIILQGHVLVLLLAVAALAVLGQSLLRLAAALLSPQAASTQSLAENALPVISVIVALYDEAAVLPGLVTALSRLNYPRNKLEIILALEAHDQSTRLAARALSSRQALRVVVLPPLGPMTKPRALNAGLQAARGDLIAIYDAEDAPHPDQLRAAAETFASDAMLGVVQAPLGWYNRSDNWLTAQFALEYATQFHALLPCLARLGWALPLGGTSNVFRRSALVESGGWDPFNVTEDADLGFRLGRMGWRAGLIEPGTLEEAPISLKAWTHQRSRWLKGHFVTWLVHMRDPRGLLQTLGWGGMLSLSFTVLANMVSALVHAPSLALMALGACLLGVLPGWDVLWTAGAVMMGFAYVSAMTCAVVAARRAGFRASLWHVLTMPAYWLLQAPAAIKALRELPRQPYLWDKTQHGVSSARRETPDDAYRYTQPHGRRRRPVRVRRLAQRQALKSAQAAAYSVDPAGHR
ncbi:glycosyltransferase [Oceanicaulis sp. MMSF_3324]|uniref:glycosyltransferase n=1 Tax=Oceanicaulis sp. MMSF_3324 TaxID=3046702 RepID=UPI00273F6FC6|nr:glycosyltransferase [Oceanicaulis sp. MMSF_3324]